MTYNYTSSLPMMNTAMTSTYAMPMTGTMMPYSALGTYGNVNSYYTGGENSVFDTALKNQATNQEMTSQAMTNNFENMQLGNVQAATIAAQTAEAEEAVQNLYNIMVANKLDDFPEAWKKFESVIIKNPIYSQSIDTSDRDAVTAFAKKIFMEMYERGIIPSLEELARSNFEKGVINGATFGGCGGDLSVSDIISWLTDTDEKASSKAAEILGGATGSALAAGSGIVVGSGMIDGANLLFSEKPHKKFLWSNGKGIAKVALITSFVSAVAGACITNGKSSQDDNLEV